MFDEKRLPPVSIVRAAGAYPNQFPYDPDKNYPEYKGLEISSSTNAVYDAVRESLFRLGLDRRNYGTDKWNPLKGIIKPGDRVFIKPNWVTHEYRKSCPYRDDLYSVITHPSIVRVVSDYVSLALNGKGEIVVGDNPSIDADFAELMEITRIKEFEKLYKERGVTYRVLDLRPKITAELSDYGFKNRTIERLGDPEGSSVLNLGKHSFFYKINPLLFRGVFTKRWETIRHHHGKRHEYSISNSILNSDVFISIPKLKTHKKVGATLNIKGLVGINANKNYLIHWKIGFPIIGGDEFIPSPNPLDYFLVALRHFLTDILPENWFYRLKKMLGGKKLELLFKDTECLSVFHHRGAWSGNDTCWRMAADLYNLYIKDFSSWRKKNHRNELRTFSIIDGIKSGEGDGPFCPKTKNTKVIIAGEDLLLVDTVAVRLMDFTLTGIKYLYYLLRQYTIDPRQIPVISGDFEVSDFFASKKNFLLFDPPTNWHLNKATSEV